MKKYLLPLLLLFAAMPAASYAYVGDWQIIRSDNDITEIAKGPGFYYVLAHGSLLTYDAENKVTREISRKDGLSSVNITHIGYSNEASRLIITYEDYDIDLIDDSQLAEGGEMKIINIPDYRDKVLNEKKTIKGIYIDTHCFAYVKTAFGYLKINLNEAVIVDTLDPDDDSFPHENRSLWGNSAIAEEIKGSGPINNWHYQGIIDNGELLTVPGIYRHWKSYVDEERAGNVQCYNFDSEEWRCFDTSFTDTLGHKYVANNMIAADPTHENRYAVAGRTGIYLFENDKLLKHYDYENSPLQTAIPDNPRVDRQHEYTISEGLIYDQEGNLWILNGHITDNELLCLTAAGEWMKFDIPATGTNYGLCSPIFDQDGHLWFVRRSIDGPYACCFDPESKGMKLFTSLTNQNGSTFTGGVTYDVITEGPDDRLWIGTNMGLIYLNRSQKYSSAKENINQYVVPRNDGSGLGDYLLAGVRINDIKFDAANRMWVSTFSDGVYLISADLNTMLDRFTSSNSLLPSDNVWNIVIDDSSGKVFFLTDNGIAVYESDAAAGAKNWNSLYCYPNPVRSNYTGKLTICGLEDGASLYISDASGKVVMRTTAYGSIDTWDLTDESHNRIDPGVYMIHGVDEAGKEGAIFKFLVQ